MFLHGHTTWRWTTGRKLLAVLGILALFFVLFAGSCDDSGACVGTDSDIDTGDVCKNDWSKEDCDNFQNDNVNGQTWSFNEGTSCEDLGYTVQCSGEAGTYRRPGECP